MSAANCDSMAVLQQLDSMAALNQLLVPATQTGRQLVGRCMHQQMDSECSKIRRGPGRSCTLDTELLSGAAAVLRTAFATCTGLRWIRSGECRELASCFRMAGGGLQL